jgi:hypothetical protein
MADHVAGGHLDRGGAGIAGERRGRAEPANITDAGEDLAFDQRSGAVQFGQGGAGAADGGFDVLGGLGDAAIELAPLINRPVTSANCWARKYVKQSRGVAGVAQ